MEGVTEKGNRCQYTVEKMEEVGRIMTAFNFPVSLEALDSSLRGFEIKGTTTPFGQVIVEGQKTFSSRKEFQLAINGIHPYCYEIISIKENEKEVKTRAILGAHVSLTEKELFDDIKNLFEETGRISLFGLIIKGEKSLIGTDKTKHFFLVPEIIPSNIIFRVFELSTITIEEYKSEPERFYFPYPI